MVRILTDGTSCISPAAGQEKGIVVVPHFINFSGQIYREWLDLDAATFIAKLKANDEIPTSIPAMANDFVEALQPLIEDGEPVIALIASREVSQAFDNLQEAAKHFPGADIRIVDTRVTSSLLTTLVLLAAEWAAAGQNADEIEQQVRRMMPNGRIYFLVPTLNYLAKGGRIGGAAAWLGTILQFKPILTLSEGRVDRYETVRTYQHGMIKMQELVLTHATGRADNYLVVTHAGALAEGQALARNLQDFLSLPHIPIYDIPPSIVCNTGPGTLGVSFYLAP
ncbi:MAG: DegV family protein [Anaerolineae bacterium]|nr:DegV family protein [Anaerolineae bacterium]